MTRLFAHVLAVTLLIAPIVRAQQPAPVDERALQAKQHYETGMAHFQLEEWDKAVEEWEAGFRTKPVPQFLYNIAQAYRLSKRPEKALSFYQKYLRMDPKASNKAEVDRQIASLTRLIDPQAKSQTAPPVQPLPTDTRPTTPVEPPPQTSPPPLHVEPAHAPAPAVEPAHVELTAHPAEKPITKKGWFWGVMGGVIAVVAGGVVIGVVLGTSSGGDSTKILPAAKF